MLTIAVRSLVNYPDLVEYIADISVAKDIDLSTFHVSLGPEGSFYINCNKGQHRQGVDDGLEKEVLRRLTSDGVSTLTGKTHPVFEASADRLIVLR